MKKQTKKESPEFPRPELYAFREEHGGVLCERLENGCWVIWGGQPSRFGTNRQAWDGHGFEWTTRPAEFTTMELAWHEFIQKIQGKH